MTDLLTRFALQLAARVALAWRAKASVPISPGMLLHLLHTLAEQDEQRRSNAEPATGTSACRAHSLFMTTMYFQFGSLRTAR
ncbi:MAG TPA: hypothetical protein VKV73_23345 [Chloroflexota bacterium]|nr:hypothetical protein [Chloroflexota bacterium]